MNPVRLQKTVLNQSTIEASSGIQPLTAGWQLSGGLTG